MLQDYTQQYERELSKLKQLNQSKSHEAKELDQRLKASVDMLSRVENDSKFASVQLGTTKAFSPSKYGYKEIKETSSAKPVISNDMKRTERVQPQIEKDDSQNQQQRVFLRYQPGQAAKVFHPSEHDRDSEDGSHVDKAKKTSLRELDRIKKEIANVEACLRELKMRRIESDEEEMEPTREEEEKSFNKQYTTKAQHQNTSGLISEKIDPELERIRAKFFSRLEKSSTYHPIEPISFEQTNPLPRELSDSSPDERDRNDHINGRMAEKSPAERNPIMESTPKFTLHTYSSLKRAKEAKKKVESLKKRKRTPIKKKRLRKRSKSPATKKNPPKSKDVIMSKYYPENNEVQAEVNAIPQGGVSMVNKSTTTHEQPSEEVNETRKTSAQASETLHNKKGPSHKKSLSIKTNGSLSSNAVSKKSSVIGSRKHLNEMESDIHSEVTFDPNLNSMPDSKQSTKNLTSPSAFKSDSESTKLQEQLHNTANQTQILAQPVLNILSPDSSKLVINLDALSENEIKNIKSLLDQRLNQLSSGKKGSEPLSPALPAENPRKLSDKATKTPQRNQRFRSEDELVIEGYPSSRDLFKNGKLLMKERQFIHEYDEMLKSSSRDDIDNIFTRNMNRSANQNAEGQQDSYEQSYEPDSRFVDYPRSKYLENSQNLDLFKNPSDRSSPIPHMKELEYLHSRDLDSPLLGDKYKSDDSLPVLKYSELSSIEGGQASNYEMRESRIKGSFIDKMSLRQSKENPKNNNILLEDQEDQQAQEESYGYIANKSGGPIAIHDKPELFDTAQAGTQGKSFPGIVMTTSQGTKKKYMEASNTLSAITSVNTSHVSNVQGSAKSEAAASLSHSKLKPDSEENQVVPQPDPMRLGSPSFYSTDSLTYSKRTFNESQMVPTEIDKSSEFTGPNLWAETLKQSQERQQTRQETSNILQSSLLRESFDGEHDKSSARANLVDNFGSLFNTARTLKSEETLRESHQNRLKAGSIMEQQQDNFMARIILEAEDDVSQSENLTRKSSTFENDHSAISNSNMSMQLGKRSGKTETSIVESDTSILAIRQQIRELKSQQRLKQSQK